MSGTARFAYGSGLAEAVRVSVDASVAPVAVTFEGCCHMDCWMKKVKGVTDPPAAGEPTWM